jgi:hypothetical protein
VLTLAMNIPGVAAAWARARAALTRPLPR